ncbi:MAG: sulfatase-like hydrolase/transferase [Eubacterium sp.]|nr:sulfatase-like hydrolase/transferase [Eubacterium sp.]
MGIFILVSVGFVLMFSARWAFSYFGLSCFEQVVFHTKVPLEGTNTDFIGNWIRKCVIKGIICGAIITIPVGLIFEHIPYIIIGVIVFAVCIIYGLFKAGIVGFCINLFRTTKLYENYYVDGKQVSITFPEKKRNLIVLYVESMETTYTSKENGGNYPSDLIPEVSALAKEHLNFSHNEKLGGARCIAGTGWTTGGLVAHGAGVPLCIPLFALPFTEKSPFLPGAYCLGDVLAQEGYEQELLFGSDAVFGGRKFFYDKHGAFRIFDLDEARRQGKIPDDYREFWGFEDEKLFAIAKEEITRLSKGDKPFHFMMLTVDTHHPHGYVDRNCETEYPEQLSNIIRGNSKKIGAFVDWLKEQPFYEDTTILIAGDHLSMAEEYISHTYEKGYERTIFNTFINAVAKTERTKNRTFTTLDMYPTILSAMGVKMEGDRLGLGVNLFSERKTLAEEIGLKRLDKELRKQSKYMKKYILKMKKDK